MNILAQNLIESILDDESLTDGLTDEEANVIINWCIKEIEKLLEIRTTESEIKQDMYRIKQKARLVCQIANDIHNGEGETKIRKHLERFITDRDNLNQLLALTEAGKPLAEQIQLLLNV
ncbi:hypothetical protein FJZ31_19105 [Candidatus Poribacteria bacterium]|nr:hypothetical protein [Candidatus Poribacteria bacterium]